MKDIYRNPAWTGTYERAVEILRQMIGNLDQHRVQ